MMLVAALAAVALALVARDAHVLDGVEDETVAMRFEARGTQVDDSRGGGDRRRDLLRPRGAVAVHALAARARDRRAPPRRRKPIVYDVQFTEPTTEREDQALFRAVRRAGDVVLATTETDGSGGTNVLGGDENLEPPERTPRRRTSRPTAAASSTASPTPRAACPASPSSRPSSAAAARCPRVVRPRRRVDRLRGPARDRPDLRLLRPRLRPGRPGAPPRPHRGRRRDRPDAPGRPLDPDRQRPPDVGAGDPGQRDLDRARRLPLRDAPGWTGLLALLLLGARPRSPTCAPAG